MVTVASEVTVPSALRLIPISPLPTVSGTIDIGAPPPRPRPAPASGCGALCWRVHQTIPATTRNTTSEASTTRPPARGLVGESSKSGASFGGFSGLSMRQSSGSLGRLNASLHFTASATMGTFPRSNILTVLPGDCRLKNRKELPFLPALGQLDRHRRLVRAVSVQGPLRAAAP